VASRITRSIPQHTGRGLALVAALLMMATSVAHAAELPPGGTFLDDDGSVHEGAVEALVAAGVTLGCNPPDNDRYCPDSPVTRAEMATFLTRALTLPASDENRFTDDDGSVHQSAIQALAAAGVTLGCNPPDNDRYCPDSPVTRAEMATFLARALDYPIISPPPRDDPPEGDPPGDEGGGGGEGDPCEVVCAGF